MPGTPWPMPQEEQLANKSVLEDELQNVPHNEIEMLGKSMPDAILEYIDDHHIDLLAMMNRGHSFFDRILIKQNIDDRVSCIYSLFSRT